MYACARVCVSVCLLRSTICAHLSISFHRSCRVIQSRGHWFLPMLMPRTASARTKGQQAQVAPRLAATPPFIRIRACAHTTARQSCASEAYTACRFTTCLLPLWALPPDKLSLPPPPPPPPLTVRASKTAAIEFLRSSACRDHQRRTVTARTQARTHGDRGRTLTEARGMRSVSVRRASAANPSSPAAGRHRNMHCMHADGLRQRKAVMCRRGKIGCRRGNMALCETCTHVCTCMLTVFRML